MILKPISDVHVESQSDKGVRFLDKLVISPDETLLLLGDIVPFCMVELYERFIKNVSQRAKNVLMVPGNHEYYKSAFFPQYDAEEAHHFMKEIASKYSNVKLFDNEIIELDGQRFIGGTMWYSQYKDFYGKNRHVDDMDINRLDPWVYEQHGKFIELVNRELRPGDIVMTHHAPSMKSAEERYKHGISASCWIHPLDALIEDRKPKYWFHGHVHVSSGYLLGETYVVCNPYGYEVFDKVNQRFDFDLKFEA